MIRVTTAAISMVLVLTACQDPDVVKDAEVCEPIEMPEQCNNNAGGSKKDAIVRINTRSLQKLTPPNVCVEPEARLTFIIRPRNKPQTVVTIESKNGTEWLNGDNTRNANRIRVKVPKNATKEENYDYYVKLSDGRCLDPRVRVM